MSSYISNNQMTVANGFVKGEFIDSAQEGAKRFQRDSDGLVLAVDENGSIFWNDPFQHDGGYEACMLKENNTIGVYDSGVPQIFRVIYE